jgi:betaine-aldehyde dehydrogenase
MGAGVVQRGQLEIELPNTGVFVNGTWNEPAAGGTFEVVDPATGDAIAEVAAAGEDDVDAAVRAARAQFDGGDWSQTPPAERARLLNRVADLVERDTEVFARLEALEVGKPVGDPRMIDIPITVDTFRHFAGLADSIEGRTIPVPDHMGRPRHAYTRREPIGVVAAITPWNAPTMIAAWKIAPALAAGCTLVVKPPEDAPLSTLHLAALLAEAGLPPGTVNVVPGTGTGAGAPLARHPGVDKISFTGSPEVGREIAHAAADGFKRVTLELGGKSPQVFLADADLEASLPVAAASIFANAGEICAAGTRIVVDRSIHDDVVAGLADAARSLNVGDPFSEDTNMGALINETQLTRVLDYVQAGLDEGAELVAGGNRLDGGGYFVEPTVFTGTNDLKIAREEIFGPVGTVIAFDDPDEAVSIANDTRYGLAAVVWTRDVSKAHLVAARIRAGMVWVNGWGAPDARLPWGGMKTSGIGRELGMAGIQANTEEKVVSVVL